MKNKVSFGDYPANQSITVNGNSTTGMVKLDTANLAQSVIAPGGYINNPLVSASIPNKTMGSMGFSTINNPFNSTYMAGGGVTNELTLEMQNTFHKKRNEELRNQNKML